MDNQADRLVITKVFPDLQADTNGVKVGSVIVGVNGASVAGMRHEQVSAIIAQSERPLSLQFLRDTANTTGTGP